MLRQITESLWVSHIKKDEHTITKAELNYLAFPRTIITCMWIELRNFEIYAKPYVMLHEIIVHSSLKIKTAYS